MKTILITGATAGIGRHAALELVRRGHHVIATGRRENALEDLKAEAAKLGAATTEARKLGGATKPGAAKTEAAKLGAAKTEVKVGAGKVGAAPAKLGVGRLDVIRLDVTKESEVRAALAEVDALTKGRGIDVLVNNAGYGQMGPLETVSDADLRRQYETNVFGLMSVTRAFVPQMRDRGAGRVINIGSIGGRVTFPLMGAYNSTKYAVESLSDALRVELAPFGIDVSIVEPGPIRTEFNDRAMETIDPQAFEDGPYAPILSQAEKFKKQFESQAVGPEATTNAIVHAATSSRRPRVRYVVPFTSVVMLAILSVLPTRIIDALFRAIAGLSKKTLGATTTRTATSLT